MNEAIKSENGYKIRKISPKRGPRFDCRLLYLYWLLWANCLYTGASVTKQHNLVLTKGR